MNAEKFSEAMNELDSKYVEKAIHYRARKRKSPWLKWSVAACLSLAVCAAVFSQYVPVEYPLNYSHTGENGEEIYIAEKNIWVYFVEDGRMERERVKLPCTAQNIFTVWKHLNKIGEDVALIKCEIVSNGTGSTTGFDGYDVHNYEIGEDCVLNIVVSEDLNGYIRPSDQGRLLESLKKSISSHSNIDFRAINIMIAE